MAAHPQGGQYDEGYGHPPQATDSYYQDDHNQGYYDQHQEYPSHPNGVQHQDYQQQQQQQQQPQQHQQQPPPHGGGGGGGGGYYDEAFVTPHRLHGKRLTRHSGYYNADANNPYQQEGGYYDGHQQHGYQDEYYNDQYYDQGTPAAGQQPQYGQAGYG